MLPLPSLDQSYEDLIKQFLDCGYEVRHFDNVDPMCPHLILRHDVDLDLGYALEIAQVEERLGVQSTFFILLTSDFYNAFSDLSLLQMREILRLGHKIGVHVDIASVSTVNQAEAKVVSEGTMLSNLLGASVDSFSFHRPGLLKQIKNYNQIDVEGFLNVYEPRLATEIGFISDSRGGWYYGHPIDNKNVLLGRPLQLLTHPIWWASSAKGCVYGHEVLSRLNEHWARQMANTLRAGFKISKENDG